MGRATALARAAAGDDVTVIGRTRRDLPSSVRFLAADLSSIAEVSRAQVALAWLLHKPAVTAPIVGATKPHHLDDAVAAVDLHLSDEELARLEADYVPHRPEGF